MIGYHIEDLQIPGRLFADGEVYESTEAVRQQLVDYHSSDVDPELLSYLGTMSLGQILAYGDWQLIEAEQEPLIT